MAAHYDLYGVSSDCICILQFYPYEGHASLIAPMEEMQAENIPVRPTLNYVAERIYADFRRQISEELKAGDGYLGPPVQEGYIWVNYRVLHDFATEFGGTEIKFKKSINDDDYSAPRPGMFVAKMAM